MNDQYGREVLLGDTVTLKGSVVDLLDDPNYKNCTVLLDSQMPPSGAQVRIDLNTQQLTKGQGPSKPTTRQSTRLLLRQEQASRLRAQRQARQAAIARIQQHLSEVRQMIQRLMRKPQQQHGF